MRMSKRWIRCEQCGRIQRRDVTSSRRHLCSECGVAKSVANALQLAHEAAERRAAKATARNGEKPGAELAYWPADG